MHGRKCTRSCPYTLTHCIALHCCIVLHCCIILHCCSILHCCIYIVLHCIVLLYCIALHCCILLYCIALPYCIALHVLYCRKGLLYCNLLYYSHTYYTGVRHAFLRCGELVLYQSRQQEFGEMCGSCRTNSTAGM